jgi:hypothetical protein
VRWIWATGASVWKGVEGSRVLMAVDNRGRKK